MSTSVTPLLGLDEIEESQGSKYLTHNNAIRAIEVLLSGVIDIHTVSSPPSTGSTADGNSYICGSSAPSSDWSTMNQNDIVYYNSGWYNITPVEGVRIWVNDEDKLYVFDGTSWSTALG